MKTLLFTLAFVLITSLHVSAQEKQPDPLKKAVANYTANLRHSNSGVVRSSMIQMLAFSKRNPTVDAENFYTELTHVILLGEKHLRTEAYLTLRALTDRNLLESLPAITEENADEVFSTIESSVKNNYIVKR